MPSIVPVTAVIELAFDPIVTVGDWTVRLETIALAVVVLVCLVVAALVARRTPVDVTREPDAPGLEEGERNHLRADDLLFIAVAALPGAVAGGRLGYVLLHLDYYRANPQAVLDTSQGSLQLSLAVVGGLVTAAIVAGLLGTSVGRWMHTLVLPLLLGIAAGKAALVLGGSGQGLPFDGAWALAFAGPGPWGSLAPEIPSHPSQVYEALATAAVLLVLLALLAAGAFRRRTGAAFLLGLALWASVRALVALTWRDETVAGALAMDQLISIAIVAGSLVLLVLVTVVDRRRAVPGGRPAGPSGGAGRDMEWPDPATRPRF
ncbi:MAG: hypothetical protein A2V85_15570 [Chloroflexi bacterium RBG_16_72_14]|nr:MAG: hypothetical protein A2V85_15570 [Chloroflexi bacterium RBG_16_72_14]